MKEVFLGIDCATQSLRGALIDHSGIIYSRVSHPLDEVARGSDGRITQNPQSWKQAIDSVIAQSITWATKNRCTIVALSISATSGTFVLVDAQDHPIAEAAMYNDGRANDPLGRAGAIIKEVGKGNFHFAHTPEFIIAHLTDQPVRSIPTDWSHALKTGVDLRAKSWNQAALSEAEFLGITLPEVVPPGHFMGRMKVTDIPIYAGMADGCTAQISVGCAEIASAVTTLGTTMVIKVISPTDISGAGYYSHLLPDDRWLTGGASNIGGISYTEFSNDLDNWNERAKQLGPASFITYPIPNRGERFPIANKDMPSLSSGPALDEVDRYRGILEGIAFAERMAYEKLANAGAPNSGPLFTVGGGSRSTMWCSLRATILQRSISTVKVSGSDIGAAMIAGAGLAGGDLSNELDRFNSSTVTEFHPVASELEFYENRYHQFCQLVNPFISQ